MAAKRRGDVAAALASLDRVAAVHPRGPLVESAAVERMRLYATTDRGRASEAARTYLARYPNGYARDEARALLAAP
jgi:outer membrane protein assembly factor BamD (BamD/ComL family)